MTHPWRPLALAAALIVTAGIGRATAQTVIVTNAKAGGTVELVFNTAAVGSAPIDASGKATLNVKRKASGETDVHVYVDACDKSIRVLLMERGILPEAPSPACERREIYGWYLVKQETTLVVDVGTTDPRVWLSQGPAPSAWLGPDKGPRTSSRGAEVPKGLAIFGGGGFMRFGNEVAKQCGNAADCSGSRFKPAWALGATYWVTPYIAAEVSYAQPLAVKTSGGGNGYSFTSALDILTVNITGKVALPVGPARVYALGGTNYSRADTTVTETINDIPITVGGVPSTIPGGTQPITMKTEGWGWAVGGGIETWAGRRWAVFVEGGRAAYKGSRIDGGGEGSLDESVWYLFVGARLHVGKRR
ncbi:MAG: outer membrane beta-barrel protein [Bacteroidales bacterium]